MREKSVLLEKFIRVAKAIATLEHDYDLSVASPEFCIQLLSFPNLKMLSKLHRKLKTSGNDWIMDFIQLRGLFALILCLEQLCNKSNTSIIYNSLLMSKCVCCIKELLNLKTGMECIIEVVDLDPTCIRTFSKACLNTNLAVKKEIYQIFSAIAMYSEEGYALCMKIMDNVKVKLLI